MAGLVIIGLDFGMALTKCAVAIQPPNQSSMESVVLAFRDEDGKQNFHLPSAVWTNADALSLDDLDLPGFTDCHLGLKRRLLAAWDSADEELVPGAFVTECVFYVLVQVLSRVRTAVAAHLNRTYPGATWTWVVNAATPCERDTSIGAAAREIQMKGIVARALAYAERYPGIAGAFKLADLRAAVAEADRLAVMGQTEKRVTILRESLAAALFALQADDAERGTWLTIDVGALTTDTSLFFFSPETRPDGTEYRVAAYYAMASRTGGMHELVAALARREKLAPHLAHARLGALSESEFGSLQPFAALRFAVESSIKDTLKRAWPSDRAYFHLFQDTPRGRKCRFRLLLVGGGSCTSGMRAHLRGWKWDALNHLPPDAVVARIPNSFGVMWADGLVDHSLHPEEADHPILAIACGLAQQPWEMPRFDSIPQGRAGGVVPMRDRVEQDWWGGN
jgi:hypothetical protein